MSRGVRFFLGVLAALSLAACDGGSTPPKPLAATEPFVPYPASDYQQEAPGQAGGTLRVSTAIDTGTLDFQTIAGTTPKWLGRLIFDNLVYLDDKGQPTPWLARSWTISPDGKTYVFKLRDDVTFSDGTPFDAAAVLANLKRIRDPATKTAMTTAYIAPYVDGKVIDTYTFQANLSEPYAPFLNVLAQSWLGMMSPAALRDHPKELGERPIGSGPFVVESYERQQGIRFAKRADYHWAPDFVRHEGPAYLDRIEVDFLPEAMARYTSLVSGQFDLTMDAPPQNAAAIRADRELVLGNRINLGNPTRAITFNTTKAPFDDVRIRRAFALGIDRDAITRSLGFGEYRPTTSFLSASTRYVDPAAGRDLTYDPARANALLDEAGWTGRDAQGYRTRQGVRLGADVLVQETANSGALMVALQSDAKKIGFDLRIRQLPATLLVKRRNANDYQAVGGGYWHTNTPDGLYIVYHGKQITSARYTGQNTSQLQDPELDDLLARARASTNPAELQDLYARAQRRLAELIPAPPLHENHTLLAYRRSVQGLVYDTSHNVPFLTTAWLRKDPA